MAEGPGAKEMRALDDNEVAIVESFREILQHGFGRLDIVVVQGHLDAIHETKTRKGRIPPLKTT